MCVNSLNTRIPVFASHDFCLRVFDALSDAASISFELADETGQTLVRESGRSLLWWDRMCDEETWQLSAEQSCEQYPSEGPVENNEQFVAGICGVIPGAEYTFTIRDRYHSDTFNSILSEMIRHNIPPLQTLRTGVVSEGQYNGACMSNIGYGINQGSWRIEQVQPSDSGGENSLVVVNGSKKVFNCEETTTFTVCDSVEPSMCAALPCHNGGSCIDECNGGFRCECPPWTSGDACGAMVRPSRCSPGISGDACTERSVTKYDPRTESCDFVSLNLMIPLQYGVLGVPQLLHWDLRHHDQAAMLGGAATRLHSHDHNSMCRPAPELASCQYIGYCYLGPLFLWNNDISFAGNIATVTWSNLAPFFGSPNGDESSSMGHVLVDTETEPPQVIIDSDFSFWTIDTYHDDGTIETGWSQHNGYNPPNIRCWFQPSNIFDNDCGPLATADCRLSAAFNASNATAVTTVCEPDLSALSCSELEWEMLDISDAETCTDSIDRSCADHGTFLDAVAACAGEGARVCSVDEIQTVIRGASSMQCSDSTRVWSSVRWDSVLANG